MAALYDVGPVQHFDYGDVQYLTSTPLPGATYDPGLTTEVDRRIRHMPQVVRYTRDMAQLLLSHVGAGFEIRDGTGPSRPRFYVKPATNEAVHAELADSVLLKAALGMAGK